MIGRLHRFHGHNSLRGVYQRGETLRSGAINLKYQTRPGRAYRVAVVVSRKVHKSAVVRNRIRRRIYEICRQQTDVDLQGLDLVFTVFNEDIAASEPDQLNKQIVGLLEKASQHR